MWDLEQYTCPSLNSTCTKCDHLHVLNVINGLIPPLVYFMNVHARDVGVVASRTLPYGTTATDRNRLYTKIKQLR